VSKFTPLVENAHFSAMDARYEVYRAHSESQEGRTECTGNTAEFTGCLSCSELKWSVRPRVGAF